MNFTGFERSILERIQRHIPLVPEPYAAIAAELMADEDELIRTVSRMKESGVVRTISGIFNPSSLGYHTALAAFRITGECDAAARIVNSHPGVSHNYERNHPINLWFTIAASSAADIERDVGVLAALSQAEEYYIFRTERVYKLKVYLGMSAGPMPLSRDDTDGMPVVNAPRILTDDERETVRLLQTDLPAARSPFSLLVSRHEGRLTVDRFLECARSLHREGVLRRFSAVLRHRAAGYVANAMTAWMPAEDADIDGIAERFSRHPSISHLYRRTVYPGRWPYPLFAMIHARSDDELDGIVKELSAVPGVREFAVLRTVREFKKERVVYDEERFKNWERRFVA